MEDFLNIISNVGFPIAVATYLLVRFEKKLEGITSELRNLVEAIKDIKK